VFLTNNLNFPAKTIADIYKARWQLELFFKWIKQNFKIKSFVGTSENAVMTQIWIAMCMYLLITFIKFQLRTTKSMQQILRLLQLNLIEKRELMALLKGEPVSDRSPHVNQAELF
jgi:IS4 transposase